MLLPIRLIQTLWPPTLDYKKGNEHFDSVFESVQKEGILEPLTMNLKWQVIDGNHRLSAARILGIKVVPVRVWTGTEYIE